MKTMNTEKFLKENNIHNLEEIESLLELASLVRELYITQRWEQLSQVVLYCVEKGFFEGLSWIIETLKEEGEFQCVLGKSIANYDSFVEALNINMDPVREEIQKIYDENGEPEAFFNINVYETGYENVYLISSENFDNKDNDFIQYKLSISK